MDNIYIFNRKKDRKMSKILREIQGYTPEEILVKYGINMKPPIRVDELLSRIGISVIEQDFKEVEEISGFAVGSILGAAISSGNDIGIFYKKGGDRSTIRFTIAHEFAHCCLDCKLDEISHLEFRTDENEKDPKELKANEFARQLLVPEKILRQVYKKFLVPSLSGLVDIFEVPVEVMEDRLEFLKLPYFKDDSLMK